MSRVFQIAVRGGGRVNTLNGGGDRKFNGGGGGRGGALFFLPDEGNLRWSDFDD